jgi:hypothetical protein
MAKNMRNIRGAIKAERAYIKKWERKQQEKLKAKYGIGIETEQTAQTNNRRNGEAGGTNSA